MKLAAKATPILLGGNIRLWDRWIQEFAKIPGGLFVLSHHLPVRDPKLPPPLYEMILSHMFNEIHTMLGTNEQSHFMKYVKCNAISFFLETLRAWGALSSLKERFRLHRLAAEELLRMDSCDLDDECTMVQTRLQTIAEESITRRLNQSASSYLTLTSDESSYTFNLSDLPPGRTFDSLYNIQNLISTFTPTFQTYELKNEEANQILIDAVSLETLAELHFVKGDYEESLKHYLILGVQHPITSLLDLKNEAIECVLEGNAQSSDGIRHAKNRHILALIESHYLHCLLLDESFLCFQDIVITKSPLVALISLLGLQVSGHFLVQVAALPEGKKSSTLNGRRKPRTTLPIDTIATQLKPYPELLHWFLHKVFCERPEIYVKFPTTAVPPSAITDLHRTHFQLHVFFAKRENNISRSLSEIPSYGEATKETPLLTFLKEALPHGGIRSDDVRKTLEKERLGDNHLDSKIDKAKRMSKAKYPNLFASELAYIIERSGNGKEDDAKEVLMLYVEGEASLPHAVAFAERNVHSSLLWESLVSFCLKPRTSSENGVELISDGNVFGSLLEVAARSGADLSQLVSKIPSGMCIEGIRPKLVTAISDYQTKQELHQLSLKIFQNEKISLMREQIHRSRRGIRSNISIETDELKQHIKTSSNRTEANVAESKANRPCYNETKQEPGVKMPNTLRLI